MGVVVQKRGGALKRFYPFPLHISERRVLLMALDVVAIWSALLVVLYLDARERTLRPLDLRIILEHPHWFLLPVLLWFPLAHTFDAYDLRVASRFSTAAKAVGKAGIITVGVYLLIPYITPPLPTSRLVLLSYFLITLLFLLVGRGLYILALSQPFFQRYALIVGAGWAGRTIAEALSKYGDGSYHVVGFIDDDPAKQERSYDISHLSVPVLGGRDALPELIKRHQITTLILAITHDVNGALLQTLLDCLELGVEIIPMPVLYEQLTGRVPIEHVGNHWHVAMPIHHPLTRPFNRLVKRLSDIVLASLGILVLAPFFPILALAIYLDSPGPIFYTQWRVGQGGRLFKAYKFRSMIPDAEKGKAVWAQENDPRVTRVGRILRKTHVDEFPQFFNILKGEMSAVGPRPERPEFVEELAKEIPFYRVRHAVKPGMAGWALVKYGYASSKEDAVAKLQYDLYYIKHQSLWLDIVILLKTVVDTLTLGGR